MKTSNRLLPYPVLLYGDDILPALSRDNAVSVDVIDDKDNKEYVFKAVLRYDNPTISELISKDQAEYLCDVYCAETMLRRSMPCSEPKFDIHLKKNEVIGRITFTFYIIAKTDIPEYYNTGVNEIYGTDPVPIEKGNVLAAFGEVPFNTRITKEKRFLINSFIMITNGHTRPFNINLDDEIILIELPESMFEQYSTTIKIEHQYDQMILSSLAMGALTHAILNMKNHKRRSWCDAIIKICQTLGLDKSYDINEPENAFYIANMMLQEPYERLFNDICNKSASVSDEHSITGGF